jgi:hypothetical protein
MQNSDILLRIDLIVYSAFICLGRNIKTLTMVLPSNLWLASTAHLIASGIFTEALQLLLLRPMSVGNPTLQKTTMMMMMMMTIIQLLFIDV